MVEGIVTRVVSQASDFSQLRGEEEKSFGHLSMKNLTTFYHGDEEVGRMHYFREGAKEVLLTKEPPIGSYRRGAVSLEYLGDGKWKEKTFYQDQSLARELQYERHLLSGVSKGFYEDGGKKFEASYRAGVLDGKVIEYGKDGAVERSLLFEAGKAIEQEEGVSL